LGDTFDEDVDELHFGFAESVGVGDVPGATGGGGVDSGAASGLKEGELDFLFSFQSLYRDLIK